MAIDKKILKEIERYKQINSYILEQEATDTPPVEDLGALAPPAGGAATPPPPAPAEATPPPPPGGEAEDNSQPIDVETDDEVTKIDDEGDSEEKESDSDTEELEITDLVDSQKNIETKQEEYFNNLFSQLSNLESKLGEMDKIMNRLNSLESKIEKYREKTPEEKLELRSYDSYPFNQKLSDFFDDKQIEMKKSGKNEYVLTPDDVTDINSKDILSSFGEDDEY